MPQDRTTRNGSRNGYPPAREERRRLPRHRWSAVHDLLNRWLGQRRELIVAMMQVSGVTDGKPTADDLLSFRNQLLDYTSAGHFEVYESLIGEAETFGGNGIELAEELYPRIDDTTLAILHFNDAVDGALADGELRNHIANLGLVLEERFELEDRLIDQLHLAQQRKVAALEAEAG